MSSERHAQGVGVGVCFDFGTSPHGLSADSCQPVAEGCRTEDAPHPLADQQAKRAEGFVDVAQADLLIYRRPEVRANCRCIRKAAARLNRDIHRLRLDSVELVQLFQAVEGARNKTRQRVAKGLHKVGALRATDSLWHKLQAAMQRCQRRPA